MVYITPKKYQKINDYLEKHLSHWKIPFNLCVRSMMRAFETGLVRERIKYKGKWVHPQRVVPLHIYENALGLATVEFEGKYGFPRKVETPYTVKEIEEWYEKKATKYKQSAYRIFFNRHWKIGTHDGRRTGIINFTLLYSHIGWDFQQELLSRTGHKSTAELEPYLREYVTVKNMITKGDYQTISKMMEHIPIKTSI